MEEHDEKWASNLSEPYNLRKADSLHTQELGYTLNMMYTLYYEMPDTGAAPLSFPENTEPEQAQ